jgi:sRNA-binding protein
MATRPDHGAWYRALRAQLAEQYPLCFTKPGAPSKRPLKVGLHSELKAAFAASGDPRSDRFVHAFLRAYTSGVTYARAMVECTERVDLAGAAAGPIADEHRAHAQRYLDAIIAAATPTRAREAAAPDERPSSP